MRQAFRLYYLSLTLLALVLTVLAGCGGDSFQSAGGGGDADAGQDGSLPDAATSDGGDGGSDTGADTTAPPDLAFDPQDHDFGLTGVGGESEPQALTLQNNGGQTTSALTVSLTGAGAQQYAIVQDECTGETLAPTATCTVSVVFSPKEPGAFEATLQATADTSGAKAALGGEAASPPKLAIDPEEAPFGQVAVGTASAPRTFQVENVGGLPTEPLAVSFDPATTVDFEVSADNCTDAVLGPTDTCTVEVVFRPDAANDYNARLVVGSASDPGVSAELSGRGATPGALGISPTPATLASAVVGTVGEATAFTVTNNGGLPIGPLTMSLKGSDAAEFSMGATGCEGKTLVAGGSCVVQVRLAPTSSGHKVAEVVAEASNEEPAVASISAEALEPARLVVQPATQNFGTVGVGTPSNVFFFLVTNVGQADSGDVLFQTTGTHAQDFTVDTSGGGTTCAGPLGPGGTCNVAVVFTPSALGNRNATLQVFATPGGNAQAQLTGEGGDAQLSIDPASHDFGEGVGTTVTFTVTNNGGVDTGSLQTDIQGTDAGDFAVESDQCNLPLASGGTCTVQVRFDPGSSGLKNATLEVSASPGGTVVAPLSGTNPAPAALTLTPSSQDFGTVVVNGSSTRTFTVGNNGGQTTGALTYQIGSSEFSTGATDCPTQLAPGQTCSLAVVFEPGSEGTKTSTLEVSASPGGTVSAQLSGTGTTNAALSISPTNHAFGNVVVGQTSDTVEFDVMNTGGQPSGTLTLAFDPSTHYQLVSDSCSNQSLDAGSTCSVTVAFAPSVAGDFPSVLTVEASPGGSASATLSGTGIEAAQLSITPLSHDFGPVVAGTTSLPATFQVQNLGSASTGTIEASLSGAHPGQFTILTTATGCQGKTLAGGETCAIEVVFEPTGSGDRTATLDVSASPGGAVSASLAGRGVSPAQLSINPTSHDFGDVAVNQLVSFTFTVTNVGGVSTGVVDVTSPAQPFSVPAGQDFCSGSTLAPNASCGFDVVFAPTQAGLFSAAAVVGADPGGSLTVSVSGGTKDIFVSMSGNDNNDGRTPSTAVRTITEGVSLALAGWMVHVDSGTYTNGESFPINIPAAVAVTGNQASYPVVMPSSAGSPPNDLVVMNNPDATVRFLEILSSGTLTDPQSLVSMQGKETRLEDCILKCNAPHCTGVKLTGDNEMTVRNVDIDTVLDDCRGIDAQLGSNGFAILDNNFVWGTLPSGGGQIGGPSYGVAAVGGDVRISNGVVTNFSTGVVASGDVRLTMRNVQVLDNSLFGIRISVSNLGAADLGTSGEPGLNTIQSNVLNNKVGLSVQSATAVTAVNNTWVPNKQGTDDDGHFINHGTVTGPVTAVNGNNYALTTGASLTY